VEPILDSGFQAEESREHRMEGRRHTGTKEGTIRGNV